MPEKPVAYRKYLIHIIGIVIILSTLLLIEIPSRLETLRIRLLDAIQDGDIQEVSNVLEKNSWILNSRIVEGRTPLHWAVIYDKDEVAQFLLSKGARLSIKDNWGETALHQACSYQNKAMVNALLSSGADVDSEDRYKRTCLHYLACSRSRNSEIAELLIEKGAHVNRKDPCGNTPLHDVVRTAGRYWDDDIKDFAEVLIENGANVNEINKEGKTPLKMAREEGNYEFFYFLCLRGAKD